MLKKICIALCFSVYVVICKGQTNVYHPFPDSNAVWTEHYVHWSHTSMCPNQSTNPLIVDENISYQLKKDTIINSTTYKKLFKTGTIHTYCWDGFTINSTSIVNNYVGALRQDVLAKKIYFVLPYTPQEIQLYDFNLSIGSAVDCFTVTTIDSILVGNSYNKRFNLTAGAMTQSNIEGVGSTIGLLESLCMGEVNSNLICFSKDGQTLYPNTSTTCLIITDLKENKGTAICSLFPNPNSGWFKVRLDSKLDNGSIVITNCLGQKIHQQDIINDETDVKLTDISSGLYSYTILSGKEILLSGKISLQ